jgi:hypothetical protein
MSALLFWGNLASIAVNGALLLIAVLMGRKFNELQRDGRIIGAVPGEVVPDNGRGEMKALAHSNSEDDDDSTP